MYSRAENLDITAQYLDIATEYIKCVSHIIEYPFFSLCLEELKILKM